ncbi:oligosaccharide flippase family protein [Candidatus Fermentibacteria bacterium]|nr:oligosaccharide flippase family protein [Candidatus Fermentibacteria bacterium]
MSLLPANPESGCPAGTLAGKGVCNVLNTLVVVLRSLVLSVVVARALGPSLQGVYSVLLYVIQVGVQVVSLGFPSTLVRFMAQRRADGDDAGAGAVLGYVIRRELFLGAFATMACAMLARPLAAHVAQGAPAWLFLIAALAILPDSLTLAYEAGFEGMLAYETLLRINLALVPASLVTAIAILGLGGGITELLILKVFLAVIRVILYRRILGRRVPRGGVLTQQTSTMMGRYTRSLSFIFLCDAVVWQRSEVFFLGIFCSPASIAFYDIAYQVVGTTMRVLPEKLTDILFPVMSGLEQRGQRERTAALYGRSVRLLFAMTLGIAVALAAYSPLLIRLLYGSAFAPAASVIRVLCAAAPVVIVARATAYVLYAAGWQDFNVRLAGAAAVVNIALSLILIPRNCVIGAALANSVTQSVSVCALVTYVLRRAQISLPWQAMAQTVTAGIAQAAVMAGVLNLLHGWTALTTGTAAGLLVYGAVLVKMGVIEKEERQGATRWVRGRSRRGKQSAGGRN